jgi:hypothetical protein
MAAKPNEEQHQRNPGSRRAETSVTRPQERGSFYGGQDDTGLAAMGIPRSPPNNKGEYTYTYRIYQKKKRLKFYLDTTDIPCKFFLQGGCQAGRMCPFSHDTELTSTTGPAPCKYFAKGSCKFGQKCALLHITPDGTVVNRPIPSVYQPFQGGIMSPVPPGAYGQPPLGPINMAQAGHSFPGGHETPGTRISLPEQDNEQPTLRHAAIDIDLGVQKTHAASYLLLDRLCIFRNEQGRTILEHALPGKCFPYSLHKTCGKGLVIGFLTGQQLNVYTPILESREEVVRSEKVIYSFREEGQYKQFQSDLRAKSLLYEFHVDFVYTKNIVELLALLITEPQPYLKSNEGLCATSECVKIWLDLSGDQDVTISFPALPLGSRDIEMPLKWFSNPKPVPTANTARLELVHDRLPEMKLPSDSSLPRPFVMPKLSPVSFRQRPKVSINDFTNEPSFATLKSLDKVSFLEIGFENARECQEFCLAFERAIFSSGPATAVASMPSDPSYHSVASNRQFFGMSLASNVSGRLDPPTSHRWSEQSIERTPPSPPPADRPFWSTVERLTKTQPAAFKPGDGVCCLGHSVQYIVYASRQTNSGNWEYQLVESPTSLPRSLWFRESLLVASTDSGDEDLSDGWTINSGYGSLGDDDDDDDDDEDVVSSDTQQPTPRSDPYETSATDYCEVIAALVKETYRSGKPFSFSIQWEVRRFVEEQLNGDCGLLDVLTVTGDACTAYAATCEQYVRWKWGHIGIDVLELVSKPQEARVCDRITTDSHSSSGLNVSFRVSPSVEKCCATVSAPNLPTAISIVQTMVWLGSVFRLPPSGPPQQSRLRFFQVNDGFTIDLGDFEAADGSTSTTCWHPLLPNTTIAYGFPVKTPSEPGLEISLEVMIDLADIMYQTDLSKIRRTRRPSDSSSDVETTFTTTTPAPDHGIFYSGVGTLLYPVNKSSQNGTIIHWHYDVSDSAPIPPFEHFLAFTSEKEFTNAQHILGFSPHTEVHLGTRDRLQDYAKMKPTIGCYEHGRPEISVETISAQFGKSPVTATVGMKIKYTQALRATRDPEKRRYDQILKSTEKQPVILYDIGPQRVAWLVSQVSVIFDLVHWRIHSEGWESLAEHARLQPDGGAAAVRALKKPTTYDKVLTRLYEDNSEYRVLDLVKEIYCAMGQRRILAELPAKGMWRLHRERLYGWDLLELAEPPEQSLRREIAVHETTSSVVAQYPSWLPLAKQLPIYFGTNLGDIILSNQNADRELWCGSKNLVASVHAMRHAIQQNYECAHFKLDCNLVWEYSHSPRTTFNGMYPYRVQTLKRLGNHQCKAVDKQEAENLCNDGAVVFGPESNVLIRLNEMIDSVMTSPLIERTN